MRVLLRSTEAALVLRSISRLIVVVGEDIEYVLSREPGLAPEIRALADAVQEASEAATRALNFLEARLSVMFNLEEGDT